MRRLYRKDLDICFRKFREDHAMSKPIGKKCLMWGVAIPTFLLEQLVNKLGLQSPSHKIKATAWKKLWPSLLVLFTTVMLVACGGSSNGDSSDGSTNQKPIAADDPNVVTNQDTAVTINVLANDRDPDGALSPDTVEVVSHPSNGTATAQSNGTIDYQPNSGFRATDSFMYRVQDNKGALSNTATVTVTIVNRDPVADGACFATPQESALAGTDRNGLEVKLAASDPDNNGLTFSLLNSDGSSAGVGPITTDKGTVEITDPTTGTFQYTPKSPPSLRGKDTFDYRVEDTEGAAASGTITVIIDTQIMPLGDSITAGFEVNLNRGEFVGYRKKLYDDLIAAGFFVDFVGSLENGLEATPPIVDPDHEGHGGINALQLANGGQPGNVDYTGIFNALEAHPADFVLLHIGTNALSSTIADHVGQVLSEIQRWEDSGNGNPVTVILARIIDQDPFTGVVNTLNNGVIGLAQSRIGSGDNIIIVNQQTALNYPDDMADSLHPNPGGYTKMADVWKYALIGEGTPTTDLDTDLNPDTGDNTGIPSGAAILTKCP
jgi:hypothetical protein